ncbi:MAG: response regulator, partial [Fusobacteriaceae bacterium]
MKILVVEDDIEIQTLISYFFTKEGFNIEVASDGVEALKKIRNVKFDLLVLDLMLPSLDGKNI